MGTTRPCAQTKALKMRISLDLLPKKHAARANPTLTVERSEFRVLKMPILRTILSREEVIFDGAEPELVIRA